MTEWYTKFPADQFFDRFSVERDRLRERERQARAQMSHQADRGSSQEPPDGAPLFGAPVRVSTKYFLIIVLFSD